MTLPDNKIPIVIGVTGHRAIRDEDRVLLYESVVTELKKLMALCPNSPFILLSSLAEGADLLCADAAASLGIPIRVALPMERNEFVKDLSPEGKEQFDLRCDSAEDIFTVPPTEKVPPEITKDFLFRQAGIYISAHCHILLALWDGAPGTSGCGTAEAVSFSLNGNYFPERGMPLRSDNNEAVISIFTPRGEHTEEVAGTARILGNVEAVTDILKKTDEFNSLASSLSDSGENLLPEDMHEDINLSKHEKIYSAASRLSTRYSRQYRRILALIAVFCSVLTLSFLLYDEAEAHWMIIICGFMLLAAFAVLRHASNTGCHRKYIEYRVLAEAFRVQAYLRYSGSSLECADLLSWTEQEETAWIMVALCTMAASSPPGYKNDIRIPWVEGQREYHRDAAGKAKTDLDISGKTVGTALILSIVLYISALVFEFFFGGMLGRSAVLTVNAESVRTVLKIVLGSISAITLFIANYFGKLSLPRIYSDHIKMERFFAKVSSQLLLRGQSDELLRMLAREELTENGNWCSYERDNKPDIGI